MRKAKVSINGVEAGVLEELERAKQYVFRYWDEYTGPPVSLTMPIKTKEHVFDRFPPFFDGVLPEGIMLEALLKQQKIDRTDLFGQLTAVGEDLVGAVTVREIT